MPVYLLSRHVHLCRTVDHVVLLDLHLDKYFALSNEQADALSTVVDGWPKSRVAIHESEAPDPAPLLQHLLANRLVTDDPSLGKSAEPTSLQIADAAIIQTALLHTLDPSSAPPPSITALDVIRFVIAFLRAESTLRSKRLARAIERIRGRNMRAHGRTADPEELRRLVVKFRLIRPFIYTARENCLKDAFVLVEYLAQYDVYPSWVFGVRTRPFSAHCWIQDGGYVLNDTPDHVGTFTPIMAV